MARKKPNIVIPSARRNRTIFENFVLEVVEDAFRFQIKPDEISLTNDGFFVLTLKNKKFIEDTLKVDVPEDYIEIYLLSILQPKDKYNITISGNDIIITFKEQIARLPQDVVKEDFNINARITEV